jgi:16S rRNA (guanine527-N7)-methyltransferase
MEGTKIRAVLERYRFEPALAPLLTESFLRRMEAFAGVLALWGAKVNLTAHPEDPAEMAFHIVDSLMPLAVMQDILGAGKRVLDLGSGAGFPGLVLASACPAHFTLVEARQKRASFLKVAAADLALNNVEILPLRLEAADLKPEFDIAISRASGPPVDFYAIAAAALRPGGLAIIYSTPSQRLDLGTAKKSGLGHYRRFPYQLRRGNASVERVLALWEKLEKAP